MGPKQPPLNLCQDGSRAIPLPFQHLQQPSYLSFLPSSLNSYNLTRPAHPRKVTMASRITLFGLLTKAFYITTFCFFLCIQVPLWVWIELSPKRRPRESWSFTRSFFIRFVRHCANNLALPLGVGIGGNGRDPRKPIEQDPREAKYVKFDGFPCELVRGDLRRFVEVAGVRPATIGGYWFGRRGGKGEAVPAPAGDEKVVMHCHGGAYVLGTAHPEDNTANLSRGLLRNCSTMVTRTFSVDYRLASGPPYPTESPFPAALLDALAGYRYLLRFGFKAENIIVMGDSAGGNLALAMARYLVENPISEVPPPRALLLLSPWVDITASHECTAPGCSSVRNDKSDYLIRPNVELGKWALNAFLGPMGVEEARKNPYISPASLHIPPDRVNGMFRNFPRIYIVSGGAERILDEIRTLKSRMIRDLNEPGDDANIDISVRRPDGSYPWVVYHEVEDGVHDFLTMPWPHQPEVNSTWAKIDDWLQSLVIPERPKLRERSREYSLIDTVSEVGSFDDISDGTSTAGSEGDASSPPPIHFKLPDRPLLSRMFTLSSSNTSVSTLIGSPTSDYPPLQLHKEGKEISIAPNYFLTRLYPTTTA